MSRAPLPPGRALALALLAAGVLALVGALWLKQAVADARVTSVSLRPSVSGGAPRLACVVSGHNPLPVEIQVRHLRLTVGREVLPAGIELTSDQLLSVPPGDFKIEAPFEADTASLSAVAGQGLSILFGRPLDYTIALRVGWRSLERSVAFSGELSTSLAWP